MSKSRILNMTNISFNDIRENELLAKISEFIVSLKDLLMAAPVRSNSYVH